jgi:hypothetical protein
MSIIALPVAVSPNTEGAGGLQYLTTYNTVAGLLGQLRVYPQIDEIVTVKAVDISVSQAGYLEFRKLARKKMTDYEVIKRLEWYAGDRIISVYEEEFKNEKIEIFEVYVSLAVAGFYNINITTDIMKERVYDKMKAKENKDKDIDLKLG